MLAPVWCAEKFSSNKSLKINHLRDHDKHMTVSSCADTARTLAVEFWPRASIGLARG